MVRGKNAAVWITHGAMNSYDSAMHADVLVIGFGKGGKTVAAQLGRLGKRVVLVEQSERMYGGTCPNVGCVPTQGAGPPLRQAPARRPAAGVLRAFRRRGPGPPRVDARRQLETR